jgi:uncharacterized protein YjbJ (UPF0337 family)
MNNSKAAGVFNEAKGKVKQAVGETFNDQSLANSGAADQVKGHVQQAWGSVKDTASNLGHSNTATNEKIHAENTGRNLRENVTNAAANAKASIERGLGHIEHKAHR